MASRRPSRAAFAVALAMCVATIAGIDLARAFGAGAGSCEHLGVGHNVEKLEPEEGIFWLKIGDSGVNVPGATIPVEIRGMRPFRGFLLRPVDGATGEAIGAFGADMPSGTQTMATCPAFATHTHSHVVGYASTVMPWIVPHGLQKGSVVRFELTLVESYERWYDLSREFVVGGDGHDDDVAFDESRRVIPGEPRAPGETRAPDDVHAPGEVRAPSRVQAPKVRDAWRENRDVGDARSVKTEIDKQRLSDARLIHGALMVVAWLFLSPGASLLARYGRDFDSWWFRAHRNAQCVALALTAFSAYIITTARGWEKPWGPHGKYGLLVIALGLAQGYMGFIRKTLPRVNFQRWHRALGVATTVLAIRNCIIGAGMIRLFESHDVTSPASGFPRVVNLCVFALAITTGVLESASRHKGTSRVHGKPSKSMV